MKLIKKSAEWLIIFSPFILLFFACGAYLTHPLINNIPVKQKEIIYQKETGNEREINKTTLQPFVLNTFLK